MQSGLFCILEFVLRGLTEEKIQKIAGRIACFAVQFGIAAMAAGYGDKALVLIIEHTGEGAAGGVNLLGVVEMTAALRTFILTVLLFGHGIASFPSDSFIIM